MTKEEYKAKILYELSKHVGSGKAIEQSELYEKVFGKKIINKHNQARFLRRLIEELRKEGIPIVASTERDGGGYFLAAAEKELENYCAKIRKRALKLLTIEAKLKNKTLPEVVAEIAMLLGSKS